MFLDVYSEEHGFYFLTDKGNSSKIILMYKFFYTLIPVWKSTQGIAKRNHCIVQHVPELSSRTRDDIASVTESAATSKLLRMLLRLAPYGCECWWLNACRMLPLIHERESPIAGADDLRLGWPPIIGEWFATNLGLTFGLERGELEFWIAKKDIINYNSIST